MTRVVIGFQGEVRFRATRDDGHVVDFETTSQPDETAETFAQRWRRELDEALNAPVSK